MLKDGGYDGVANTFVTLGVESCKTSFDLRDLFSRDNLAFPELHNPPNQRVTGEVTGLSPPRVRISFYAFHEKIDNKVNVVTYG